jgi:hypothetical protein
MLEKMMLLRWWSYDWHSYRISQHFLSKRLMVLLVVVAIILYDGFIDMMMAMKVEQCFFVVHIDVQ